MYEINLSIFHYFYLGLVFLVGLQRLWEMRLSKKHERILISKGALEVGHDHFPWMKLTHGLWLLSCLIGTLFKEDLPSLMMVVGFGALFFMGQILRIIAIKTLGERWTVKILVLPGVKAIDRGIFRYIRHPNYLGVILEIFALPLIFGLGQVAAVFSIINALILYVRIKKEEEALSSVNFYQESFSHKNRFLPTGKR